jgi:hypothetical protein
LNLPVLQNAKIIPFKEICMSANDTIELNSISSTMSDLEKIRSEGKHGIATINLKTGKITHSITGEGSPPLDGGPQGIGYFDPDTGEVGREFFFGNVQNPVRGEVYRWHSEFDPYMIYYVGYKWWFTSLRQKAHWIICPGFDFRFQGRARFNLYVIQQSVTHPILPRLGMIHDENERIMAKALIKLAHEAWPTSSKRGKLKLTKYGLVGPPVMVDFKGVDRWRLIACALWCRWKTEKATWEAKAADIRELCPDSNITAERLRRECAKDRLGLLV